MQAQFTEQSRRAICNAQTEVREAGATVVEPEHLLLAILRDKHSGVWKTLREKKCPPRALVKEVCDALDAQPVYSIWDEATLNEATAEMIPLSSGARTVLDAAVEVARRSRRRYVGPDHLLTGLILHPSPLLTAIWARHGVSATPPEPTMDFAPVPHESNYIPPEEFRDLTTWARFTDAAQRAVAHAQNDANRSGFNAIPPLFLLSGVLQDAETVVTDALQQCNVERNSLRETLIDRFPSGPGFHPGEPVTLDADSLAAVEEARRVAATWGDRHIGTEHLFLGLLADRGESGELLRASGVATANFLDGLRYVNRGKRAEGGKGENAATNLLWWLLIVAAILVVLYLSRQ